MPGTRRSLVRGDARSYIPKMAMNSNERRALAASANRLPVTATVGGETPSDAVIAHVRSLLARRNLIKVRVNTDDRATVSEVAAALAERVPCEVVRTIGRVAVLHG